MPHPSIHPGEILREELIGIGVTPDPHFWLNLQSQYDLRTAEEQAGAEIAKIKKRAA